MSAPFKSIVAPRFHSCSMQGIYLWSAIRSVELNLVRAGLVSAAKEFPWSSATAHLSGKDTSHLPDMQFWSTLGWAQFWEELLASLRDEGQLKPSKPATHSGKLLRSADSVKKLLSDWEGRSKADHLPTFVLFKPRCRDLPEDSQCCHTSPGICRRSALR